MYRISFTPIADLIVVVVNAVKVTMLTNVRQYYNVEFTSLQHLRHLCAPERSQNDFSPLLLLLLLHVYLYVSIFKKKTKQLKISAIGVYCVRTRAYIFE